MSYMSDAASNASSAAPLASAGATPATSEPTTVRIDTHVRRSQHNCWDDEDVQDFINELLNEAPEEWDADVGASEIATSFLNHLVGEVKRLGGCLKPHCWDNEPGEWPGPCDHGYR